VNICLKCGAEVSPVEYCPSCGAALGGVARGGERTFAVPAGDRLGVAAKHVDDLLKRNSRCKIVLVVLLLAAVGSFVLSGIQQAEAWEPFSVLLGGWIPPTLLCLLAIVALYKGLLHFRIISAKNDEAKLLRMISEGNRVCAACRAILSPGAVSCSSCGGDDIRVSGVEDIRIPVTSNQSATTNTTQIPEAIIATACAKDLGYAHPRNRAITGYHRRNFHHPFARY
jgi:ribosomal protein L40E